MAWLIHASGTTESVDIPKSDSLDFMQQAVNGYIEVIRCDVQTDTHRYIHCIVNEEGIMQELDPNMVASKMLDRPIVGTAIFLEADEWD